MFITSPPPGLGPSGSRFRVLLEGLDLLLQFNELHLRHHRGFGGSVQIGQTHDQGQQGHDEGHGGPQAKVFGFDDVFGIH